MTKRLNKSDLRQGFCYYLLATLALALIFFSYIFRGASTDMMTPIGWIYFSASCLTHAAHLLLPRLQARQARLSHHALRPLAHLAPSGFGRNKPAFRLFHGPLSLRSGTTKLASRRQRPLLCLHFDRWHHRREAWFRLSKGARPTHETHAQLSTQRA